MTEPDATDALPVRPGTLLAGKYRVDRLLARGGMGAVVKARHEVLEQDVAVKLMRREMSRLPDASQRFLREARAAAKINSDYVARVTDTGLLEDGTPYMVMEYLEGEDLSDALDRAQTLEVSSAVDCAMQALAGLEAAHRIGVVHRDLKPANLFLVHREGQPRVKLLDFGISKVMDGGADEGLKAGASTACGAILGTPRYMSPEQFSSAKDVDARTDLWSMGLILYEALTGEFPFEGTSAPIIMSNVLTKPIAPLRNYRSEVPVELAAVVHRCLERDRAKRYSSARELMRALAPFASARVRSSFPDVELATTDTPALAPRAAKEEAATRAEAWQDPPASQQNTVTITAAPVPGQPLGTPRAVRAQSASPRAAFAATEAAASMSFDSDAAPGGLRRWALGALFAACAAVIGVAWWLSRGPGATPTAPANPPASVEAPAVEVRPPTVPAPPAATNGAPEVAPGREAPAPGAALPSTAAVQPSATTDPRGARPGKPARPGNRPPRAVGSSATSTEDLLRTRN